MATEYTLFQPKKYESIEEWKLDLAQQGSCLAALVKEGPDALDRLQTFLAELVWATLRGEISAARSAELLQRSPIPSREPLQRLLVDVLWMVGFSATESPANKEMKEEFQGLCDCLEKDSVVSRQILALGLDVETVPKAVCNIQQLKKKQNQAKTKAKYTITRFNLLREHSEGYSKLTFLLGRLGSLEYQPQASPEQLAETAERLVDDVVQLMGFSHLCPNRILCMALDVYELRLSESDTSELSRPMLQLFRRFPRKRLTEAVIFQLLQHSVEKAQGGGEKRSTPAPSRPSQFLAVAALVAQGLVDLDAVWSYLEPTDDALKEQAAALSAKYDEEVSNLSKVDLAASSAGVKVKDTFAHAFQQFNTATHQKFRLAAALVSVNCWWAAHKVLVHLQTLCKPSLNHFVREALCDLLKWIISPLLVNLQKKLPHQVKPTLETSYGAARRFSLGCEAADSAEASESPAALQQVKDIDQLIAQIRPVLDHLEYFMHTDLHLLSSLWKVLALFVKHRQKEEKAEKAEKTDKKAFVTLDNETVTVIYKHLLPAASLVPANPYLGDLMWIVMGQLSCFQRNFIYSCWGEMYERFLLKLAYEKTKNATKQILKRVVSNADRKDLIAHQSHFHITKLCHSNPIPALEVMLKDVEVGFNVNMIQPYVECTNRCPEMTADVMSFIFSRDCVRPQTEMRNFLNPKDAMLSPWLNNLGEFIGRFYKKHPSADLVGLLQIVTKRINSEVSEDSKANDGTPMKYKGESLIRVILEGLIEHMGGYLTVADMNAEQLLCLAGGPRLKSESVAVGKKEDASRKDRARQALFTAIVDLNLVQVLWYSLGQQRHHFLSESFSEAHSGASGLKLLGLLFDGNHECFLKVTEFLTQACSREKYMALLPPMRTVFSMFEPALAFLAVRHGLPPYGISVSKAKSQDPAAAEAAPEPVVETAPELKEIENVVRLYLPPNFEKEGLSLLFYTTFWRLTLQDIMMPTSSYEKAVKGIDDQVKALEKQKREMDFQREKPHPREYKNLKKEVTRLQDFQSKLKEEKLSQSYAYSRVRARLESEKKLWFLLPSPEATGAFVAEMICPRVLTSHADALFCCQFVRLLIDLKTPGFQLLDFYNHWTVLLTQNIRCCSEREATIFGVFLREMMSYIIELRKDEAKYKKTIVDNPAFHRNYYRPDQAAEVEYATFADMKKGHAKWEGRIHKAMKQGLDSDDWMEKRNMLLMLSQSTNAFPSVEKYGKMTISGVEHVRDTVEHQDVKTLAMSLVVKLKVRSAHWLDKDPKVEIETRDVRDKDSKRAKNSLAPSGTKDDRDRDRDSKRADERAEKRARDDERDRDAKAKASKEKDSREPKEARAAEKDRTRTRDVEKPREKDRDGREKVVEHSKSSRDKDPDRKRPVPLEAPPPSRSSAVAVEERHEKRRRTEVVDAARDRDRDRASRNALNPVSAPRTSSSAYYSDQRPRDEYSRSGGGYGSSRTSSRHDAYSRR